jgi:hypothetical protein
MTEQEPVEQFAFEWKSTSGERDDGRQMAMAMAFFTDAHYDIVDVWGGTAFGEWSASDGLDSDNGLSVVMTLSEAAVAATTLSVVVGHPVTAVAQFESA